MIFLYGILCLAVVMDLFTFRISNRIILAGYLAGICYRWLTGGWIGTAEVFWKQWFSFCFSYRFTALVHLEAVISSFSACVPCLRELCTVFLFLSMPALRARSFPFSYWHIA